MTLDFGLSRRHLRPSQVNQALRVQLLNTVKAEADYASSRASMDRRQVKWLLSAAQRKALPAGVLHRLQRLEREEHLARQRLPGSISKLVKGYELRMWGFEVTTIQARNLQACLTKLTALVRTCGRYSSACESLQLRVCPSSFSHPALPLSWCSA